MRNRLMRIPSKKGKKKTKEQDISTFFFTKAVQQTVVPAPVGGVVTTVPGQAVVVNQQVN